MKKFIYYLPRVLSILIVCFFAIFILEGFGPEFGWQDSLMHALIALVVSLATVTAWKWPKIGGWIFVVFGFSSLIFFNSGWLNGLIISGVPIVTGILFLIEGLKNPKS